MDAATLQARIRSGYAKAALRIGYQFSVYRPQSAGAAIAAPNLIGSPINAAFTVKASQFNFNLPGGQLQTNWLGLFDPTTNQVGDYLYNPTRGTYYILAIEDQLPVLCVKCTNTLSVLRPSGSPALGVAASYSGAMPANEAPVITSWPANLLYGQRGRNFGGGLPLDQQMPYFIALMPAFPGTDIRPADLVTDTNSPARRYFVAASERTPYGWRLILQHANS